ncbi:nuclear transport factor 2 family protein [Streptomyces sp. NBC_00572]|uniref:nuclear transport factor 2 family protein n=1 Tax=Streptomyces sp. NBC_00572 TaxID=2903664 RepID=UPI0022512ED2|nr:nuclear transport factor 2 family protein [Streptomyces sp. NBC_00572]MCX4986213.1 nuclear transport factor 2 family protein [Streptomyces sp. NBC_00572]
MTGFGTTDDPDIAEAVAGELALLDPAVRVSRAGAAALLDPEFIEVGASGRRWTYEEMLAALPEMSGAREDGPSYEPSALSGTLLAPGLVHLTYETLHDGHRARRSSLWRRDPAAPPGTGLRMYYHQGTPVPETEVQP